MGLFPLLYIIERCSCGSYYEKILTTGEVKCIDEEIPFEIPTTWSWARLGSLIDIKGGKRLPAGCKLTENKTNHIYIRVSDMQDGTIVSKDLKYITDDVYNQIQNYTIGKDDLYLTIVGSTIGKAGLVPKKFDNMNLTENAVKLTNIPININKYFLLYYVRSEYAQSQFRDNTKQVGQPKLAIFRIANTLVPVPPFAEQIKIVSKIECTLHFVNHFSNLQKQLYDIDADIYRELKRSILQEAIQGRLVPQIAEEGTAQELLEQIKAEKQKFVKEGKLKKSVLNDSVIFRGGDNKYYEQIGQSIKCIDDEIPFEIPNNWLWTRLSYVSSIYTGNSISEAEKRANFTEVKGRYYIGTKDVGFDNKIVYNNGISIPLQYEQDFRIAPANSILMCIEGGSAGKKIAVLNQDVCFGNKLCCFSPFVEIGKFMYYYLQSPSFIELFNLNKTGIIGGVSIAKVKEIVIPLPPLVEQQRIVAQIEKLFEQLR